MNAIKTDYDITKEIINYLDNLNINKIIKQFNGMPSIDTEVEFYPVITHIKDAIERLLKISVILGGWLNENHINIRKPSNLKITTSIKTHINSIDLKEIENIFSTEQGNLDYMIHIHSELLRFQYYFMKWAVYLYDKYHADISQLITFVFKS